jgi:hypothetical protein
MFCNYLVFIIYSILIFTTYSISIIRTIEALHIHHCLASLCGRIIIYFYQTKILSLILLLVLIAIPSIYFLLSIYASCLRYDTNKGVSVISLISNASVFLT